MRKIYFCVSLVILAFSVVTPARAASQGSLIIEELLEHRIEHVSIHEGNFASLLSSIANRFSVPIGLEVSSFDELQRQPPIEIEFSNGTLRDLLNAALRNHSHYQWEVRNNVINVFPNDRARDALLRKLLDTKLETFVVKRGATRFSVRDEITKNTAVARLLRTNGISVGNQTLRGRDFDLLGPNFSLAQTDISVLELLNRIVADSKTKFWLINRYGESRDNLVLVL